MSSLFFYAQTVSRSVPFHFPSMLLKVPRSHLIPPKCVYYLFEIRTCCCYAYNSLKNKSLYNQWYTKIDYPITIILMRQWWIRGEGVWWVNPWRFSFNIVRIGSGSLTFCYCYRAMIRIVYLYFLIFFVSYRYVLTNVSCEV